MLPLGTPLPPFVLPDAVSGTEVSEADLADRPAVLVMFICNHCPFVKHVLPEIGRVAEDYGGRGVGIVAINSNDVERYPQDGPVHMQALAAREGWKFPFLLDERQTAAHAFRAACTPDFFLFDGDRKLAYRGQLDASRPGNDIPLTGYDLRSAIDAVLAGRPVSDVQVPSVGCNIKWTPGNEPPWFG
jgi:thiol-disulfide isomerase/thioredoxin